MATQTIAREMTDNANLEKASYCVLPARASYCVLPARASYCVLPQNAEQVRPRVDLTLEDPFKVLAAVA